MTQENPPEKKSGSNIKVIALAIICIILAASTVGTLALYLPNQTQITDKDQAIAALNQQITALQLQLNRMAANASQISELNSRIAYLTAQLTAFNASYSELQGDYQESQSLLNLARSENIYNDSLTQNPSASTSIFSSSSLYAGYIVLTATSNSSSTYAQIRYTYNNLAFDYNKTVGASGTVLFPILPTTIEITIGNLNPTDGNDVNATATIYY